MKKYLLFATVAAVFAQANAQSAMDGYLMSQPDLKGTARFMSMGGAFGALGGDLSTMSYNPAGIGVYRSSEIGATFNFDAQSSKTNTFGEIMNDSQFKFPFNNAGYVGTVRLPGKLRNFNWGFTYNRTASFNRRYKGIIPTMNWSASNYIAGIANSNGITEGDLARGKNYDPYNPDDGGYVAPWITILGYESELIRPTGNNDKPNWYGLYGNGTYGSGEFESIETGGINEYNISFGGNINNIVYWGMDFGITDLNYTTETYYAEYLTDARLANGSNFIKSNADWDLYNYYHLNGTGFNYKFGLIVKPIQELRLGLAFHTPTYYSIDESFYANTTYNIDMLQNPQGQAETNSGYDGVNGYRFHTPWRIIASAAGVIGSKFIISADYEWQNYQGMSFSERYTDYWSGSRYQDPYYYTNTDIDNYYQTSNTIRIGAEYRVSSDFSLRAGYSNVSSPVKKEVRDNQEIIYTAGTRPDYSFDDDTNYVTCGFGYRYKGFYIDAAYVWKQRNSTWHAFTPDPDTPDMNAPESKVKNIDNQIVVSMGFKF